MLNNRKFTLENYEVYFYILSFFVLISIAIIMLYKKTKYIYQPFIIIVLLILFLQLFLVYDTYPNMEHL